MKGNITNIPLILVAVLTVTISVFTAYTILNNVIDSTDDTMIDQEILGEAQGALMVFDYGIVFLNASFYIAAFILAVRIRTSPLFALPAIFFLGISIWLSAEIANIYSIFGSTNAITAAANQFTVTASFFQNLPLITLGLGALLILVIYTGVGRSEVQV